MFDLQKALKELPDQPGVYIMHDKNDTIIYVGKAKILKNRVRQYFQSNKNHTPKVKAMVANVEYFEYIVTDSELEALVLECNLIKKHRPKYNILLKDDKQYPYLKVTICEDWPKIFKTRALKNDGGKYFGPYMGTNTVKNTLEIIQKVFKPPQCMRNFPQDIGKGRPCLNYHIKNCFAPCTGNVSQEEYKKVFEDICAFLEGDHKKLVKELTAQMNEYSKAFEYEKAAVIRDRIKAISAVDEKQKVINSDRQNDKDIIAMAREGDVSFVELMLIRSGKMCGRENFKIENTQEVDETDILTDFVKQFYRENQSIPDEVITQYQIEDEELLSQWLTEMKGARVQFLKPQRGEKVRLVEMAVKNAELAGKSYKINKLKIDEKKNMSVNAAQILGLEKPVVLIEAYDISNISGEDNVASMVVFENGKPLKSRYRKFKIKSFEGADDYRAMQEVLYRRLNEAREEREKIALRILKEEEAKFLPLPDVIFVDGGKGHVAAAELIMEMTETEIPIFGMVKDDRHRTRGLVSSRGEIGLNPTSSFFHMITRIQDEVHRTAITYHRKLREKITSELETIEGIGEARRNALLKEFGTIEGIKNADFEALVKVPGMNKKAAESILEHFGSKKSGG